MRVVQGNLISVSFHNNVFNSLNVPHCNSHSFDDWSTVMDENKDSTELSLNENLCNKTPFID